MTTTTDKLREFHNWLMDEGLRRTTQRDAIAAVILDGDGRRPVKEILAATKAKRPRTGYATVYRTLHLLVAAGLVVEHPPVETCYEIA